MIGPFASGALGVGDRAEHHGATKVALSNVVSVAVGWMHTCAIVRGGQVYCWGVAPLTGHDADPALDALVVTPQQVTGLHDAAEVAVGEGHSCARRAPCRPRRLT